MNRRQRLMSTLRGEAVDRPALSFYELNGLENPADDDPFNIFSHPSWMPLIELTRQKTDRIVTCQIALADDPHTPSEFTEIESHYDENGNFHQVFTVRAAGRTLTKRTRRDKDVNTVWTPEHLLKNVDDLKAFLQLPLPQTSPPPETSDVLKTEELLGSSGIVMLDTPDPLCLAAELFDMGTFTVIAMTQPELFHQALERYSAILTPCIEAYARVLPGRLWRIFGPEYASPPYLPPHLFSEYVVSYDTPLVQAIQKYEGFVRIHCHGNLKSILDDIVSTCCVGLDPIEPPPQGDVELGYVRQKYGKQLVLFGNLEISDIENLPTPDFEKKVITALQQGTSGDGKGFVLMPSAAPYGRELASLTLKNYEKIIEVVERF